MTNLLFTLWMLLFPVTAAATSYVYEAKLHRRYADGHRALCAFFEVVTWLGVGYLLYGA